MNLVITGRNSLIMLLVILAVVLGYGPGFAAGKNDDRPDRAIFMAAEYPGVEVPLDENVSMDIIFRNKGKRDENMSVRVVEIPDGWKAKIKSYRYTVTGIHVPGGEDKSLTFDAEPGKAVKSGEYRFRIEAQTEDGKFKMDQSILVIVSGAAETSDEDRGVKLTTSYPVIRGPSDGTFEFSVDVDSKLDKDAIFDLFANGPKGWDINFKPAYESKYITSLRLKSNQNQSIAVEVKPALMADAGEYPINIRVSSGEAKGEVQLAVVLTGTYDLEVGTPSGLLSLDARQGKPANMSFYVKNTGSATNQGIKFLSFKPENWEVEFKPESIDIIEPGDLKQVELIITPYEEALVGDYSINVNVEGEKASEIIEFRTTVKASAAWGWIGIGIIVVVIAGLFGIFRWLGRR
ncbi:MAG: NEW3 domain-containing protein [Desulfobacterales bacterium]|nr:NEW3 domain-containing protein [Desulfobacterales bacterium]